MEVKTIRSCGFEMRTAVWPGQGDALPLLCFNGIGANLELLEPLQEVLVKPDVIAFDVPGTGDSPTASFPYRPWMLAAAVKGILDELGYTKVNVIGISWGGAMAQQFAFQYPRLVEKLVLAATSPGTIMIPGNPASLMKMTDPRRYADPEFMKDNFEMLYGDAPHESAVDGHTIRMKPPTRLGYFMQLTAMAGWTSLPWLRFMKTPTLIMAGRHDKIVPTANARILNFMIPDSRLEIVDGGHLFLLTNRKASGAVLRDFFEFEELAAAAE